MKNPPEGHRWSGRVELRTADQVAYVAEEIEACEVDRSGEWALVRFRNGVEDALSLRTVVRVRFDPTFAAVPLTDEEKAERAETERLMREASEAIGSRRMLPLPLLKPSYRSGDQVNAFGEVVKRAEQVELDKIDAALREAGIEYPLGAKGVEDLATLHGGAEERLTAALDLLRRILGAIDEADPIGSRFGEEICALIDEAEIPPAPEGL